MNFEYYNPNPDAKTFKSGKPKYWGREDDAVRALCKITNKTWETIYDELSKLGLKDHDMINSKTVVNNYLNNIGSQFITLGKPKTGEKRITVAEFANKYNTGVYVLYLRDYYVVIENGILYNTVNTSDEAVYSYWIIN